MQGMGKALVGAREGIGKACVRDRQGLRKIVVIWVCGHVFGPVCSQPQAPAVSHRARPAQLLLRPSLILMPEVGVENAAEFGNRHAGPVAMVIEPDSRYQCS